MNKAIGEFTVAVSEPYPCWVRIQHGGAELRFSHRELADLEHLVREARREAARLLPDAYKGEA